MKILHLIFSLNVGGTESMLVDMANEQANLAEVSVAVVNREFYVTLLSRLSERVNLHLIGRDQGSMSISTIWRVNYLIATGGYDTVHCHNHNMIGLILPFYWKKTVLTVHTMGIVGKYLKRYKRVFAISDAVRQNVLDNNSIAPCTISNGVLADEIVMKPDARNPQCHRTVRIVQVGRLEKMTKGQHLLIEAIRLLAELKIKVHLDFIGAGSSEDDLKRMVSDLGLKEQITFLGLKEREFIYCCLKDYDLLVQPSYVEGFGLTVVEAMLAKVPVLVSDIEGPMEVIDRGTFGYHFKSGNSADLARAILSFVDQKESVRNDLVERAYQHALDNYSLKNTARAYLQEYQLI